MIFMNPPPQVPEFVILGIKVRKDNSVLIMASRELVNVEFEHIIDYMEYETYVSIQRIPGMVRNKLSLDMHGVVIVAGKDYNEAFAKLFGTWSPDTGVKEKKEIGTGTPQLGGGTG